MALQIEIGTTSEPSHKTQFSRFPNQLHIVTYDVRGKYAHTGLDKITRQTGIVTQTHHLIRGFAEIQPNLHLAITQTGVGSTTDDQIVTPDGQLVHLQGIQSGFTEYLRDARTGGKDKKLVKKYYEDEIDNPINPVYQSLAEQYASVIRNANTPNILLQNPNPIVSVLKAEEFGKLDEITLGQLNVTGVVHDVEEYRNRLTYIRDSFGHTKMNLKLVAVSQFVYNQLADMGMPIDKLYKIPNGMDIQKFDACMQRVREQNCFNGVKRRNNLPDGKMILVPARRVPHKGHLDVIDAMKTLRDQGRLQDAYAVFTGNGMLNTQAKDFEQKIRQRIAETGLQDRVFLTDSLTSDEVNACYAGASMSVLASTEPEGFAYANVEAMLAGVPVITTRLGGPLDYIQHGETGLFVDTHSPDQIADRIDSLLSDQALYTKLVTQGRIKAENYTIENMASGYTTAINAGEQMLPIKINPGKTFEKIGEGMHTEVYRYRPGSLIQVFKPERSDLRVEELQQDYHFLRRAYSSLPGLIPYQRLLQQPGNNDIHQSVLYKREVVSTPGRNTLLTLAPDELSETTKAQLATFVAITKQLVTAPPVAPEGELAGGKVPDIIDPDFTNLLIDTDGNLRLVDTNRLISTRHLQNLIARGNKLDIDKKVIHAKLLRRLMYIDAKFFGATKVTLQHDPFYTQFIAPEDFNVLFTESEKLGEQIR